VLKYQNDNIYVLLKIERIENGRMIISDATGLSYIMLSTPDVLHLSWLAAAEPEFETGVFPLPRHKK
jgi:hypothetical protein